MELIAEQVQGATVIQVASSRIDAAGAIAFKDRMRSLTEGTSGRVILDLGEVGFIDSSGLGAVVAALKQLDGGRKLELAALTPAVEKVMRLTRMDGVFPIHESAATALDAGRRPG